MTRRNDRARTSAPSRRYVAAMPELARLEAELRASPPPVASLTASATASVLDYVRCNPGSPLSEVMLEGCFLLSRRSAEILIRGLFTSGQLRGDPPNCFNSRIRVYLAED